MTRYLLDTGIAGDFVFRRRRVYQQAREKTRQGHRVGTCPPVLGELWYGIELSATRDRNAKQLRRMLPELVVWPYDDRAAEEFGRLAAHLRRTGRSMQQIDIQVAAIALTLGQCVVVTTDTDLAAVPGLAVENWSA
jgi:tRNA(fMet)-specific endonuclease VapC